MNEYGFEMAEQALYRSLSDTPPASVYQEYDRRKAELWLKYGPGVEYDRALTELIDELGV